MKELIEKIEKEIAAQTKNGEEAVEIDADDLNRLGYGIDPNKKGKTCVDVGYLKIVIQRYKFKDQLKVERKPMTFKELEAEIKNIERGE